MSKHSVKFTTNNTCSLRERKREYANKYKGLVLSYPIPSIKPNKKSIRSHIDNSQS